MAEIRDLSSIKKQTTIRIPEHEVLISFNCDWHAAAFQEWLYEGRGLEAFEKWALEHAEDFR